MFGRGRADNVSNRVNACSLIGSVGSLHIMSTRRSKRPALALQHGALAFWLPVFLMAATSARANERPNASAMAVRLQALVDLLRSELKIPQDVALEVVDENPLMASVEPAQTGDGFVLAIEGAFASRLSDDELKDRKSVV